jgi:hypothetical protein
MATDFTDAEWDLIRQAVGVQQRDCARAFAAEHNPEQGSWHFYRKRLDEFDALMAKLEARLAADASQDTEEGCE